MITMNWETVMGQLNDEYILEAFGSELQTAAPCDEKEIIVMKTYKSTKRLLLVAVVAVMVMALAIGGVAAYVLGMDALLRPDKTEFDGKTYGEVSLTQPQDWDETALDAAIVEKLENNKKAWAEWVDYKANNPDAPVEPRAYAESPDGTNGFECVENEDGSYTVQYWKFDENYVPVLIKELIITAEEYEYMNEYNEIISTGYGDYDFKYGINSAAEALKLEEIAGKYGLKLRGNQNAAFSSETTGQTGAQFFTNAQLAAKTAEVGCRENLFTETPVGFDKMYWFDEGTFCVSYYVNLPSSGKQVTCYGYNSCYGTLSSGAEVYNWEVDASGFDCRNYVTADGTEVTILSNGTSAYIYVYLNDSFFVEHIYGLETCEITDDDLNYIADYLKYSVIGD